MRSLSLILCLAFLTSTVRAESWQQFRGPSGGKLEKVTHPLQWGTDKNIAWAVPSKGTGWSSPVVVGDRVFLTSAVPENGAKPKGMMAGVASMRSYRSATPVKHKYVVSCLSLADGKEIWNHAIAESIPPVVHPSNTYATESPATDGERLFTFFATTGDLVAWDLDGNQLWKKNLGAYNSGNGFGSGSSLAISDGKLFVQYDNDEKSFVVAFSCAKGDQVWRDDRPARTSWSSPLVWEAGDQKELIACGSDIVTAYAPQSGEKLWQLSGMKSAFSGSPAIDGKRIYFGNSGPMSAGPLVAVKAGTRGEVQLDNSFKSDKIAWSRVKSGPGMASPIVSDGRLYIPGSGGTLSCYDTETGERVYRTRVDKMGTVAASLWGDDERVFIMDENGNTFVIQSGPEFKLLATSSIKDLFWSTPTITGDKLLIRGVDKLYCVSN